MMLCVKPTTKNSLLESPTPRKSGGRRRNQKTLPHFDLVLRCHLHMPSVALSLRKCEGGMRPEKEEVLESEVLEVSEL
jgi:hypothetical protein